MMRFERCQDGEHEESYIFHCPGCKCGHQVFVRGGPGPRWEFNGDMERPTITPSYVIEMRAPFLRCHSFIRNGQIQFLNDSTHELKGKTVELPSVWGE